VQYLHWCNQDDPLFAAEKIASAECAHRAHQIREESLASTEEFCPCARKVWKRLLGGLDIFNGNSWNEQSDHRTGCCKAVIFIGMEVTAMKWSWINVKSGWLLGDVATQCVKFSADSC
jgi:hypothetical protein